MQTELIAGIATAAATAAVAVWEMGRRLVSSKETSEFDEMAVHLQEIRHSIRALDSRSKMGDVDATHPHRCRHNDEALKEATTAIRELTRALYDWRAALVKDGSAG